MTLRGIESDLTKSNYHTQYGDLLFVFSSLFYKSKFDSMLDSYIIENTKAIYKKYKINLRCDYFLAISLYKKIEKRGFYILNTNRQEIISEYKTFEVI